MFPARLRGDITYSSKLPLPLRNRLAKRYTLRTRPNWVRRIFDVRTVHKLAIPRKYSRPDAELRIRAIRRRFGGRTTLAQCAELGGSYLVGLADLGNDAGIAGLLDGG